MSAKRWIVEIYGERYTYELPGDFDACAVEYVSENVAYTSVGRPWVPEEVWRMTADVEAAIIALCGRAVSIGDEGTTGWLLPCRLVSR